MTRTTSRSTRRRYQTPAEARRVSLTQIAVEVGWKKNRTKRFLREHSTWAKPIGFPPTYDAQVIDLILEMKKKARRPLFDSDDWLAAYLNSLGGTQCPKDPRPDPPERGGETPTWPSA